MLQRAFRERWPLSDERRAAVIEQVSSIASDPESSANDRIQAMRTLLEVDKLELKAAQILINAKQALTDERRVENEAKADPALIAEGISRLVSQVEERDARPAIMSTQFVEPLPSLLNGNGDASGLVESLKRAIG